MSGDAPELRRFAVERLRGFIDEALRALGMNADDAGIVAGLMAEADLNGSDGHGIFRLAQYARRIESGGINLRPDIRVIRDAGATALIDGDNAMGHLVMRRAAALAIEKARAGGIGWVGARGSNHAGPAALYCKMALQHDMIGIYAAIGNANHLPPWGGVEMLLSTNPIAFAVPAGEELDVVLDMATTVAAYGKVKTARLRGESMPEGWMIDREGRPLTDPERADEGFLLPIGGAKGYGLALMLGFLAGTLNGAAFGSDVVDFNKDFVTPTNTGHFIAAISLSAFGGIDDFKRRVDRVIRDIHSSPTLPGFDRVRLPGERSHAERLSRESAGIPLHEALVKELNTLAASLNITPLE
jgi:L-2-hydroxycarboxylate dehydrogenase (NAD+)